jgi:hypothetical protein
MVGQRPDHIASGAKGSDLLVRQDLIDYWSPQVTIGEVGVAIAIEGQHDLVAIVDKEPLARRLASAAISPQSWLAAGVRRGIPFEQIAVPRAQPSQSKISGDGSLVPRETADLL